MRSIEEKIDELRTEFEARIEVLAEQYRSAVVLPLCRKHKLEFTSGMGSFSFHRTRRGQVDVISDGDDAEHFKLFDLIDVFGDLNVEVMRPQVFGFYVHDISKSDW